MSVNLIVVMATMVWLHILAGPLEKMKVTNTTALIDIAANDLFMQNGDTLEDGGRDLFLAIKPLEMQLSYRGVVFPMLVASYIDLS